MPKRPTGEPVLNPTLFDLSKPRQTADLATEREEVERPVAPLRGGPGSD
jgi:hypothetical protein